MESTVIGAGNNDVTDIRNLYAKSLQLHLKIIKNEEHCERLQRDILEIHSWSKQFEVEFNINRCHTVRMVRDNNRATARYEMTETEINAMNNGKDLGVFVQDTVTSDKHMHISFRDT